MADKKTVDWGAVLNSVGASQKTGQFLFPKGPKTRFRFVQHPHDDVPFRVVENDYKGKVSQKFLFLGYNPDEIELKGIILPLTAFRSLIAFQAEGWDFFDNDNAYGAIVLRDQMGQRISYTVMTSKKEQPADPDIIAAFSDENDLDYFEKEWIEWRSRKAKKYAPQADAAQTAQPAADWD